MKTILMRSFYFLAVCLLLSGCEKKFGEGVTLKDIATEGETSRRLLIGVSTKLYAYPLPYDCTDYDFKWESSDTAIVKVDDFGRVTTKNPGTATISVSQGSIRKEYSLEIYELPIIDQKTGYWTFEDAGNLGKATVGADLELSGSGFSSIAGPGGKKAVQIVNGSYFKCTHGSGSIMEYTVMMDFKMPAIARACFIQTSLANNNDVDFYMRSNMYDIGVVGAYADLRQTNIGPIEPGRWYRLFIVIQLGGTSAYYLDGEKIGEAQLAEDNRMRLEGKQVLLFADEDGEDDPIDVANVVFWGRALTKAQVDEVTGDYSVKRDGAAGFVPFLNYTGMTLCRDIKIQRFNHSKIQGRAAGDILCMA
jgi:hypothetical protein